MDKLETALRRQRWLTGILLMRVTELRLLREANELRYLERAEREVEVALRNVREAQLICAVVYDPGSPDTKAVVEHRSAIADLEEEIKRTSEESDQKV